MAITILAPAPAEVPYLRRGSIDSSDSDDGGAPLDVDGDSSMRPAKRAKHEVVTPGEIVTDDPQWMRGHGTYIEPGSTEIIATVAGTKQITNKLMSVRPLRARYTPEIGDLVIGRIVEVQSKRWRVEIGAPLLASLPLAAINLPGGILRKRTDTDELQIRTFFSEGDLLVCEVQSLHNDGSATLHTRSLKYGKLRNGAFVQVKGVGGGGGVVRSRRQVWTLDSTNGGGKVDVILGVNGYIWISKHVEVERPKEGESRISISKMEEQMSSQAYSSQNDEISSETRREIARLRSLVELLVEAGLRVDEDILMKAYGSLLEIETDGDEGVEGDYLGGEKGKRVIKIVKGEA